jgi:glucokinase
MTVSSNTTRPAGGHSASSHSGLLLAGDVGGTKTALALFSAARGPRTPLREAVFPTARYASLGPMLREFLAGADVRVERASIAVAGPVQAGRALVTSRSWHFGEAELAEEIRVPSVHILNDLEAIALATVVLQPGDLHVLNAGKPVAGGAVAVIGPGTGLGESFLAWNGARYLAFPSEGGHADFAPATDLQARLLAHVTARFGHVSIERVCSGPGLLTIYDFLRESGHAPESTEMARRLATAEDKPRTITEAALRPSDPDPLAHAALELFVSILGAEAGNLALKVLATGGVYLAGGIPMRILPALEEGRFMRAFLAKGRMREFLMPLPVHVITSRAALLGAALRGLDLATASSD